MKERQFNSVVESKKLIDEILERFGNSHSIYINIDRDSTVIDLKPYLGNECDMNVVRTKSIDDTKVFLKEYNLYKDPCQILEETKDSSSGRVKDYIIADIDEANDILSKLKARAITHGVATVADYYDIVGIEVQELADYDYGWTIRDIQRMEIKASNGGWYMVFPKVRSIQ